MTAPKRIHFTWKTKDVPGDMARYLARWRELHPDWQITLWTDATMRDFVAETYPDFLAHYDGYPRTIQRADSFRYLVLNALGGIYADLDVEPFRAIDELVAGRDCFAGIEPDEHIGSDRRHSGAPFLVTNAFMGGVAGHPWFRQLVELLPQTAGVADVFLSTGPGVTTAAALRLPRAQRPVLVLPAQWSPEGDGGRHYKSDDRLKALLAPGFDFVAVDGRFVAHRWVTSWEPWYRRWNWVAKPFHLMNAAKWAFRKWRHKELAAIDIKDTLFPYFDQFPKPPATWPTVGVCVVAEGKPELLAPLGSALAELDYPTEKLSLVISGFDAKGLSDETPGSSAPEKPFGWHGPFTTIGHAPLERGRKDAGLSDDHWRMVRWSARANACVDAKQLDGMDWVLFVDGGVTALPSGALKAMLSADKPVVALGAWNKDSKETDLSVFRYRYGGGLRTAYKIRGEDGLAEASRGQRDFLPDLRAFAQIPLDGAGQSCVLVRRDVLEAGARFAETPYHLHLGGEGLALMARHKGFEVAGLTELAVERTQ